MYAMPMSGQKVFEVAIYNTAVRDLVKDHKSHSTLDDQWADVQIRDVVARDENEARRVVEERYPPTEGFVIDRIQISAF